MPTFELCVLLKKIEWTQNGQKSQIYSTGKFIKNYRNEERKLSWILISSELKLFFSNPV